jgi:predicted transposase YdaD
MIKSFLVAHRAEVKGMLLAEYKEAETMELFKEEGREEGRKEGRVEGRKEGRVEGREEERVQSIRRVMSNLKISADKAMDILGIPSSERTRYSAML